MNSTPDDESADLRAPLRRRRTAAYGVLAVSVLVTIAGIWGASASEDGDDVVWLAWFAVVAAGLALGFVVTGLMGGLVPFTAGGAVAAGAAGAGAAMLFLIGDQFALGAGAGLGAVASGALGVWLWTSPGRHRLATALGFPEGKPKPGPPPRRVIGPGA